MPERELISYIHKLAEASPLPWLEVGIGDDCAVLRLERDDRLVATTDMLIEGTHYEPDTPPEMAGRKAIARALSDLAAMAARPLCTLAAASFRPHTDEEFCRLLCRGLWNNAAQLGAPLIGGDISSGAGAHTLAVTALGSPGPAGSITRSGARAGDAICVTGALGGSIGGRHLTFSPRLEEALDLAERFDLHAMIDISDGLSTDLGHLTESSGIGAVVEAGALPVHEDLREELRATGASRREYVRRALNDGEDYELLFCLPEPQAGEAERIGAAGTPVTIIGRIQPGSELKLRRSDGTTETLEEGGWEHLSK